MNLFLQSSFATSLAFCGGVSIYKGAEKFKENKISSLAKITFGTLMIGAGIGILACNQELPPLKFCDKDASHPSCSKILTAVQNALEYGGFNITSEERRGELFPMLTETLYNKDQIKCRVFGNTLQCKVSLNQKAIYSSELLRSTWDGSLETFKLIPGFENIKKLKIITWNPDSSFDKIAEAKIKLLQLIGSLQ